MPQGPRLPSLAGTIAWLNTEPLEPAGSAGSVVLVNFWTLTCINWLRQEPHVRAWSQAYRDDGLVVLGVHTPEFSFEHDIDRVRQATVYRAIDYPVAVDNDYKIWDAFANHYWPALYIADGSGVIRHQYFGEGRYEETESVLQQLLGVRRPLVEVKGLGVEAEADWNHLRSPETYLGYERSDQFSSPGGQTLDEPALYSLPGHLRLNQWALAGRWRIGPESVVLEQSDGTIAYRFHARDAHLVLSCRSPQPVPFRVRIDGEDPALSHGEDIDEDGHGLLEDGRLYSLVRMHDGVRDRTLEITFLEAGAEAYVFTFG